MIIVKLMGGLGNQMFQYAAGRALAQRLGTKFMLDISHYQNDILRKYALDCFVLQTEIASDTDIKQFQRFKNTPVWYRKLFKYYILEENPLPSFVYEYFSIKGNVYLDGYWQSEKYFHRAKDIILKDFRFKNENFNDNTDLIKGYNSVSLHIRRGDYISSSVANNFFYQCDLSYWEEAIKYIYKNVSNPYFYIFTDDIKWVNENIHLQNINYTSASTQNDLIDFWLMSKCKHNIIANSSYSWWAAFINNNIYKIVIAPKKWFSKIEFPFIYPESWKRI